MKRTLVAIVAAFAVLVGSGAAVNAQPMPSSTGNAQVTITSDTSTNYLAVHITNSTFAAVPFSFINQDTTGSLTVTATDTRGTAAGWNVVLSASDFARDGSTSFDISNLSLIKGTLSGVPFGGSTGVTTGITTNSASPVAETGIGTTTILSAGAGSGMGSFALPMNGTLTIPGGTLVGTYNSTVTVAITAGP